MSAVIIWLQGRTATEQYNAFLFDLGDEANKHQQLAGITSYLSLTPPRSQHHTEIQSLSNDL